MSHGAGSHPTAANDRARLRRAGAGDVDAVAALFRRSFGTLSFLPTLHGPDEDRAYFARVVRDDEVWVAEEEGRVVGFAALGAATLDHLYVDPQAWRRGIGAALFHLATERRPLGFGLWTFQRNAGARHFYERFGCRQVKMTDGSDNEEKEPDVLYEWRPPAS